MRRWCREIVADSEKDVAGGVRPCWSGGKRKESRFQKRHGLREPQARRKDPWNQVTTKQVAQGPRSPPPIPWFPRCDGYIDKVFPSGSNCAYRAVQCAAREKWNVRNRRQKDQRRAAGYRPHDIVRLLCGRETVNRTPFEGVWRWPTSGSIVPTDCYEWGCGKGVETEWGRTTRSAAKRSRRIEPKPKARKAATRRKIQFALVCGKGR